MATPFESAQLILQLYDVRREATMRKARDFVLMFDPKSFEDLMAEMSGPNGAYLRQVISYWDMAASFVARGAIDSQMFLDSAGESIVVFAKIEPFLPQVREALGYPFAANLEKLAMSIPDARQRIDSTRERIKAMLAARAAKA